VSLLKKLTRKWTLLQVLSVEAQHPYPPPPLLTVQFTCIKYRAGIFKQSMGARNWVGICLSYRPARLHRLADSFLGIDSLAP
jgi:hypothetical protein